MGTTELDLDTRINGFLARKQAEFPELATAPGRHGSRTVKHASQLRASGQLLLG